MQDTAPTAGFDAYGDMPYYSLPHTNTDPNRLAVVAQLHGLEPPDVSRARVLDIGCGDSANCLAIAAAWPESRSVGIDLSEPAILRGRAMAAAAGITNVELIAGDLLEFEPAGEFDFVLLHGLVSWVPAPIRDAAIRIAAQALAPNGLVMCDYNALPGWHRWMASRELLRMGAATSDGSAVEQIAAGRDALALAASLNGGDSPHAELLRASLERAVAKPSHVLYHDDMGPAHQPYWVDEFADIARAQGLVYVGEARQEQWWEVFEEPAAQVRALAGSDPAARQKLADLVVGPEFKGTVFARADAGSMRRGLDDGAAATCIAHADRNLDTDGIGEWPDLERTIATRVLDAGGRGASLAPIADELGVDPVVVSRAALGLAVARFIELRRVQPPVATGVDARPVAHALSRKQAESMQIITRLVHDYVVLEDVADRALLTLLDGTRTHAQLADALSLAIDDVGRRLSRFAAEGLLAVA